MNYVNSEPRFPSHPDPVLSTGPVDTLDSRIRGVPIEIESDIKAVISESVPDVINNDYRLPINPDGRATGTVIEENGTLYVQKCLMGEFYYESCALYGDTSESTTLLAHSIDVWTLCDIPTDVPPGIPPDLQVSLADDHILEDNQRMA